MGIWDSLQEGQWNNDVSNLSSRCDYGQEFLFWTLLYEINVDFFLTPMLNAIIGFYVYFVLNFRHSIESGTMT